MKQNDLIPGIHALAQQISPEAIKAQRMAELKNIAEYRARRMDAYRAWVNPEAMAKRKKEHEEAAAAALEAGMTLSKIAREQMASKKLDEEVRQHFKISPLTRAAPKPRRWWQRLLDWFYD